MTWRRLLSTQSISSGNRALWRGSGIHLKRWRRSTTGFRTKKYIAEESEVGRYGKRWVWIRDKSRRPPLKAYLYKGLRMNHDEPQPIIITWSTGLSWPG